MLETAFAGLTGNRTRIGGFRVHSANHYTIKPSYFALDRYDENRQFWLAITFDTETVALNSLLARLLVPNCSANNLKLTTVWYSTCALPFRRDNTLTAYVHTRLNLLVGYIEYPLERRLLDPQYNSGPQTNPTYTHTIHAMGDIMRHHTAYLPGALPMMSKTPPRP